MGKIYRFLGLNVGVILNDMRVENGKLVNGYMSAEEKRVLSVFVATAIAWMSRSFLLKQYIPAIDDTIIAMVFATLLFLIPSSTKGENLLIWEDTITLPWGILMLFGGGMALALGFETSGLGLRFLIVGN